MQRVPWRVPFTPCAQPSRPPGSSPASSRPFMLHGCRSATSPCRRGRPSARPTFPPHRSHSHGAALAARRSSARLLYRSRSSSSAGRAPSMRRWRPQCTRAPPRWWWPTAFRENTTAAPTPRCPPPRCSSKTPAWWTAASAEAWRAPSAWTRGRCSPARSVGSAAPSAAAPPGRAPSQAAGWAMRHARCARPPTLTLTLALTLTLTLALPRAGRGGTRGAPRPAAAARPSGATRSRPAHTPPSHTPHRPRPPSAGVLPRRLRHRHGPARVAGQPYRAARTLPQPRRWRPAAPPHARRLPDPRRGGRQP